MSIVVICKDEPQLDDTLGLLRVQALPLAAEIVVVDASEGRLDWIRQKHPSVQWVDFRRPPRVRVSIPHQRNRGIQAARGDIVVFTDAGCLPHEGWLAQLLEPIFEQSELVTCGPGVDDGVVYAPQVVDGYITQCPTLNVAFHRRALNQVGPFDESFEYGSDLDLAWRLTDQGIRLRWVDSARVEFDLGSRRRRLKRGYVYGVGRARLYRKHKRRAVALVYRDPVPLGYGLFLAGLPLTLLFPLYPLLLLVPLLAKIGSPEPAFAVATHLFTGLGFLSELTGYHERRVGRRSPHGALTRPAS